MSTITPMFPQKIKGSGSGQTGPTGPTGPTGTSYFSQNAYGIYYLGNVGIGAEATSSATLNMGGNIQNITSLGFDSSVSNLSNFKIITFSESPGSIPADGGGSGGGATFPISFPYSFINTPSVFVTITSASGTSINKAQIGTATLNITNLGFILQVYNFNSNAVTSFSCNILVIGI
jgi:hypothetical protein